MQGRHGQREARANAAEARRLLEERERERQGGRDRDREMNRGRAQPGERDGDRDRGRDRLQRGDGDNVSRHSQSFPRETFDVSPGPSGGEDSE